jgi:xylan 1,4-beta-xylosidase
MRLFAFVLICLLFIPAFASAQQPQYGDYIDLPGAGWPADPTIIEVDGTWYLYPTTNSSSIECWSSTDLDIWTYEGAAWGPAPAGSWNDHGVWAPDVFEHDGLFYMYYTADEKIGVAEADNPLGPFVDVYDHPFIGGGYGDVPFNSIDAHVFRDTDGSLYLYATGYSPLTFLRVFPMVDPVTLEGSWEFLLIANPFGWDRFVIEAPWMVLRDGIYYLMYSGFGADRPQYAVGYATANHPTGPFTKYERNPILKMDPDYDFYGPGHHTLTEDPAGDIWMFYHTKINDQVNWERRIRKNKIDFTDDGQIYVDLGLGPPPPLPDDDDDDDDNDDDTGDDDDDDDDDTASGDDDDQTPAPEESGDSGAEENDEGCCG